MVNVIIGIVSGLVSGMGMRRRYNFNTMSSTIYA